MTNEQLLTIIISLGGDYPHLYPRHCGPHPGPGLHRSSGYDSGGNAVA